MFTLTQYFGYMIKETIDPDFNGNFFMNNTHYRGPYAQYYPAFINALEEILKNDLDQLELIVQLTPSWKEAVVRLKKNREKIYKASELIARTVQVNQIINNTISKNTLRIHAVLFIVHYFASFNDPHQKFKIEF